jgi:hypothetical protein
MMKKYNKYYRLRQVTDVTEYEDIDNNNYRYVIKTYCVINDKYTNRVSIRGHLVSEIEFHPPHDVIFHNIKFIPIDNSLPILQYKKDDKWLLQNNAIVRAHGGQIMYIKEVVLEDEYWDRPPDLNEYDIILATPYDGPRICKGMNLTENSVTVRKGDNVVRHLGGYCRLTPEMVALYNEYWANVERNKEILKLLFPNKSNKRGKEK